MSDEVEAMDIDCKDHGKGVAAIVCVHLLNNKDAQLGFIENNDEPHDLQAWCYACEYLYQQEEDMTDKFRAFNGMSMVCTRCYSKIKRIHEISL